MSEDERRILRLAPDCDPTALTLSAEEGFLLSRIDGHTPWRLLREMGGMDSDEADMVLEGWLATGLVEVLGHEAPKKPERRQQPQAGSPTAQQEARMDDDAPLTVDEALLDEHLDLDVDVQRRILAFESGLGRSYYALLGVSTDADAKQIKKAYFKLSKEFHPDRYFRREIGHFAGRLERIFKKILEAHEILSDDELRAELEKRASAARQVTTRITLPTEEPSDEASARRAARARPAEKPLSKLERLKQRMPFKIPESVATERRQKAEELFKAAEVSKRMGRYAEAVSSIRVALSFDPYNQSYKNALVELQAGQAESLAREILDKPGSTFADAKELKSAVAALESLLVYKPHDPEVNHGLAAVLIELGEHGRAKEYVQTAIAHSPDVAAYHATLGRLHQCMGEMGHARKEYQSAIGLDPDNAAARKALASLRLGRAAS